MNKIIDEFPELDLTDLTDDLAIIDEELAIVSANLLEAQSLVTMLTGCRQSNDYEAVQECQQKLVTLGSTDSLSERVGQLTRMRQKANAKIVGKKCAYANDLLKKYKDRLVDEARGSLHVLQALQHLSKTRDGPTTWWNVNSSGRPLRQDTMAGNQLAGELMRLKVIE